MALKSTNPVDLTDAERFGRVVTLDCDPEQLHRDQGRAVAQLWSFLSLYSDGDYFLPIGDLAFVAAASAVLGQITGGTFSVLRWDPNVRRYFPVRVQLGARQFAGEV